MLSRLDHPVLLRSFGAEARGTRGRTSSSSISRARDFPPCCAGYGPLPPEQLVPLALELLRRDPLPARRASSTST